MSGSYFFFDGVDWDLGKVGARQLRNIILSGDIRSASQNGGQLAGLRNKIINGSCQVAQRSSATITNGALVFGGADRFISLVSATTVSGAVSQAVGFGTSPIPRSKFGNVVSVTTTGTTNVREFTRLESADTRQLNGLTVTLSCRAFQDTGLTLTGGVELAKATATDNFATTASIASATYSVPSATWTTLYVTVTLGSTDGDTGLQGQAFFNGIAAVSSKNFYFTDWQLEEGPIVTPLELHPFALELASCLRYLYDVFPGATSQPISQGAMWSTTEAYHLLKYPVPMRVPPVVTFSAAGDFTLLSAGVTAACTSVSTGNIGRDTCELYCVKTPAAFVAGNASWVRATNGNTRLTFNAEL